MNLKGTVLAFALSTAELLLPICKESHAQSDPGAFLLTVGPQASGYAHLETLGGFILCAAPEKVSSSYMIQDLDTGAMYQVTTAQADLKDAIIVSIPQLNQPLTISNTLQVQLRVNALGAMLDDDLLCVSSHLPFPLPVGPEGGNKYPPETKKGTGRDAPTVPKMSPRTAPLAGQVQL